MARELPEDTTAVSRRNLLITSAGAGMMATAGCSDTVRNLGDKLGGDDSLIEAWFRVRKDGTITFAIEQAGPFTDLSEKTIEDELDLEGVFDVSFQQNTDLGWFSGEVVDQETVTKIQELADGTRSPEGPTSELSTGQFEQLKDAAERAQNRSVSPSRSPLEGKDYIRGIITPESRPDTAGSGMGPAYTVPGISVAKGEAPTNLVTNLMTPDGFIYTFRRDADIDMSPDGWYEFKSGTESTITTPSEEFTFNSPYNDFSDSDSSIIPGFSHHANPLLNVLQTVAHHRKQGLLLFYESFRDELNEEWENLSSEMEFLLETSLGAIGPTNEVGFAIAGWKIGMIAGVALLSTNPATIAAAPIVITAAGDLLGLGITTYQAGDAIGDNFDPMEFFEAQHQNVVADELVDNSNTSSESERASLREHVGLTTAMSDQILAAVATGSPSEQKSGLEAYNRLLDDLENDIAPFKHGVGDMKRSASDESISFYTSFERFLGELSSQIPKEKPAVENLIKASQVTVGDPSITVTNLEQGDATYLEIPLKNANTDTAWPYVISVDVGGETVLEPQTVTVPPGTDKTYSIEIRPTTKGTHEVVLNGHPVGTITVGECEFPADQNVTHWGYDPGATRYNRNTVAPITGDTNTLSERWFVGSSESVYAEPALVDGILYTVRHGSQAVALEACTGSVVWTKDIGEDVWGRPAVVDGQVYYGGVGGTIYALDAANGDILTQNRHDEYILSIIPNDGELIVVNSHSGLSYHDRKVASYDQSLQTNWSSGVIQFTDGIAAITDDMVLLSGSKDRAAYSLSDGTEVWSEPGTFTNSGFAVKGNNAYCGGWSGYRSGPTIARRDATTGQILAKNNNAPSIYTEPIITDDAVYFGGKGGVHAYDPHTLTNTRSFSTSDNVDVIPAIADETLIVADGEGTIYGFNTNTGAKEWTYDFGMEPTTDVTVAEGKVFIGGYNGLYALD